MTELKAKNLIVLCFDSLGAAYQAVQLAGAEVDVLEVFPLGLQGHVIFCSDTSLETLLQQIQAQLKENIITAHSISDCPAKVLRAYLSVENAEIADTLLVMESAYIGDLMVAASAAVSAGLHIMDLRMLRGASSASYMFLTGEEGHLQKFAGSSRIKSSLIRNANNHIRALFNIQP